MKRKLLISVFIALIIMALITPATAQVVPSVSGTYSIATTPPADAARIITANPGQTIQIDATASGSYSGPTLTNFPVKVTVYTVLYKGGVEKNSNSESISKNIDLATGDIPATTGTTSIRIPDNAEPGNYLLKIIATLEVEYMGVKYTKNSPTEFYTVKVVAPTPSGQPTDTPSPTPTPVPTHYAVNQSTVQTTGDGNATFNSGNVTGTVENKTVAGGVTVNLTNLPENAGLNMYTTSTPDPTVESQFLLASANSGTDITDIAFVLVVDKQNLKNGENIANATITMKVSKAWVDAHGGIDAIKIFRYSDGYSEALETHYIGMEGDLMVFQALSPHGLSQFALAAVATLPKTAAELAPQGAQASMTLILGVLAALVIVLVAGIGVVYVVFQRKKNKKQ